MNEQDFRELSAARALHALSAEDEQAFSHALAAHPEWQPLVTEDQDTAAALGNTSTAVPPPPAARSAILDLIAQTPQFQPLTTQTAAHPPAVAPDLSRTADPAATPAAVAPAADTPATSASAPVGARRPGRNRAAWFALAASIAVLLTAALAFPWGDQSTPQDPTAAALQQLEAAADAQAATATLPDGASATLHWSAQAQQAVLVTEAMPTAPTDRDYELWIVRGDKPISLGVMRVNPEGHSAVLAPGFQPGDALAVTVEAQGGSATGAPTSEPIMVLASA